MTSHLLRRFLGPALALTLSFLAPHAHAQATSPDLGAVSPGAVKAGWELTWHDEFSGPYGAAVDPKKWNFETGGWGWGNGELQYYTGGRHNAQMDGSGRLVITARAEDENSGLVCGAGLACKYTSARLNTKGKFEQRYGRMEARIQVPRGQGLWPAFWMLGADFPGTSWPNSGEIDIMEHIGREPNKVYGTLHGPGYSGGESIGQNVSLPQPAAQDFHVYAVEWEENEVRWYVDGDLYQTRTPADLPGGTKWVYDHPFFLILNLAVGGGFPGYPDERTVFPRRMLVDYVRVYRKAGQ